MNGTLKNENILVGTLAGSASITGDMNTVFGKDGKSAYEIAVKNGFEGTEEEWLESLIGEDGENGVGIAKVTMVQLSAVDNGNNVIEIALTDGKITTFSVRNGSKGSKGDRGDAFTYSDFTPEQLAALKGADGYTPQKGIDYFDGKDGEKGNDGVSVNHSWNGTVLNITSASGTTSADLKGEKGDRGNSGVYVGTGDMPDDCNVQIDPEGVVIDLGDLVYNTLLLKDKMTGTIYKLYVENGKLTLAESEE